MVKMLRLVQNEYIKILKKTSTIIIFILIAVMSVGLIAVSKFAEYQIDLYMSSEINNESDYTFEIKDLELNKPAGYELMIEKYNFMKENKIKTLDWRKDACERLFALDYEYGENGESENAFYALDEASREALRKIILDNDWKAYCETMLADSEKFGLSEGEKWEYRYRIDHGIPLAGDAEGYRQWQNQVITSVVDAKNSLAASEISNGDKTEKAKLENTVMLGVYRLDNDISLNIADCKDIFVSEDINLWSVLGTSASLITVIGLLLIVITGSSVASEFSQGTIKFLLINPVKRWKILVSKYITCISLGYILMFLLYILTAVLSMIFFGTGDIGAQYITVVDGAISATPGFVYILKSYLLASVNVVVMSTLAFAISSLARSSALSIGVSLFSLLSGNTLIMLLKQALNQDWARYLIFANTNLLSVSEGTTGFSHHSMTFAVSVIAVHMVIFFLIAWDGFTRKEV